MDGVLNINKPPKMTSHDVVDHLRRLLHEKRVGHTGTLDPDATGVLPVCLGKATKIIQFIQDNEKCYEGTITLGIVTDTSDASGRVIRVSDSANVEADRIRQVFSGFVGEISQIPPMVSALKSQGRRLYEIARQGKTVARLPRKVYVFELEPLSVYREKDLKIEKPYLFTKVDFRVRCSKGTYIRTLAEDIGNALGCGAHLSRLIRTRSGIFKLEDSIKLEEIQADPQKALSAMRTIDDVLAFLPKVTINAPARKKFLNGAGIDRSEVICEDRIHIGDVVRVYDSAELLLGIGEAISRAQGTRGSMLEEQVIKVLKVLNVE